jgi:hypothetical protein
MFFSLHNRGMDESQTVFHSPKVDDLPLNTDLAAALRGEIGGLAAALPVSASQVEPGQKGLARRGLDPTVGRIVLFHSHVDGARWPAIVQSVDYDGSLRLFVFGPHVGLPQVIALAEDVPATSESQGYWSWPPRQ